MSGEPWRGGEVRVIHDDGPREHVVGPPADRLGREERIGQHVRVLPREPLASAKLRAVAEWWHYAGRERYVVTELPELTVYTEPVPGAMEMDSRPPIRVVRVEGRGRKVRP